MGYFAKSTRDVNAPVGVLVDFEVGEEEGDEGARVGDVVGEGGGESRVDFVVERESEGRVETGGEASWWGARVGCVACCVWEFFMGGFEPVDGEFFHVTEEIVFPEIVVGG